MDSDRPETTRNRSNGRRARARAALWLLVCAAVLAAWPATPTRGQPGVAEPGAEPVSEPSEPEAQRFAELTERLRAADALPAERTGTALALLESGTPEALAALADALDDQTPAGVRVAVLDAIRTTTRTPPTGPLPDAVYAMRTGLNAEMEAVWAEALGRYELERLADDLAATARDDLAGLDARRLAIRALGEHRRLFAAEALIELTSVNQLEQVQGWAFDALANLSHQPRLGRDRAAWAGWYNRARRLSASQWRQMLHDNLLRLTRERGVVERQARDRLIQTQRALHRATAPDQRPTLLIEMLQDPLDPIRTLAMELLRQRAEDNGEFGEPLRQQLRARLDDALTQIREEAATLLGQLLDAEAADTMAARLGTPAEPEPSVQRAYLIALTQMPRVEAIGPGYELLEDPALRPQAAGMLAAALRGGLGDTPMRQQINARVRAAIDDDDQPLPQMVTLLGLVIADDDADGWARIGRWLDADDERVRAAAAQVWAGSPRSLAVLAERSDDPVIRPIALRAIADRGSRDVTLAAIAQRRPTDPDDIRLWEQALVALAGRVPERPLLDTVEALSTDNGETRQVREHMLTAAIDRPNPPDPPTRDALRLLIARAEVRVLNDAPALVVLDYEAALQHADRLNPAQLDRARRGLARAYLADQRIDAALKTASDVLKPGGQLIDNADADDLVTLLIGTAKRSADQGRADDAATLITQLRTLLGESLSEEHDAQLRDVQTTINRAAQPQDGS